MSQAPIRDPVLMEAINKIMSVPERLSVGPQQGLDERCPQASAYTMTVPDRLTYTEAPELSASPLLTRSRPVLCGPLGLEPVWDRTPGEGFYREALQSPIRRSYSDQSFGRTPPGTPTQLKQELAVPRHPSSFGSRVSGRALHQRPYAAAHSAQTKDPQAQPLPPAPHLRLTPQSMVQMVKHLFLNASHFILQPATNKSRSIFNTERLRQGDAVAEQSRRAMESWSQEDEGEAAIEFMILRRQVMKMSRRLASLERYNADRRNTEVVLFSLLFSACLLNVWLWIRR